MHWFSLLMDPRETSRLVANCIGIPNELGIVCELTLGWVPCHSGVVGNEIADGVARYESELHYMEPDSYFGLGNNHPRERLNAWMEEEKRRNF